MKKYMIDKTKFNEQDCIEHGRLFDTCEDAKAYLAQFITEVEVGYLVTMDNGSGLTRYVWVPEDVDDGGYIDAPNGTADCYETRAEAEKVRDMLQKYADDETEYIVSFGIEEVIL